ncbi:MAG: sulfate adenylyltransferase [Campylobacteraceae bacterium]|nr:sulfate adenylyltransferase [Campylobacteraceae bacterium]
MELKRKNRELHIDKEALSTLALAKEGILGKVNKLMNKAEAQKVNESGFYKGSPMPFSFIMAPSGKRNQEIILSAKAGETLDLVVGKEKKGELFFEDAFEIDKERRVRNILGTYDPSDPETKVLLKRLGDYAVSGEFELDFNDVKNAKEKINNARDAIGAKKVTALMMAARPFHRAHERLLRMALDKADLLVIFLLKPHKTDGFSYDLRYKCLDYFINNYLPKNRVIIIPFENTYIFAGHNNSVLESIAAYNFGCNKLVIGQNHSVIGMFYDQNQPKSNLDRYKKELPLEIVILSEFVYCNSCKTLVSTKTCPHGQHKHIRYHSNSLKALLEEGILPPAVLMRKEISAIILSELFPNRFANVEHIYDDIFPNAGLLEDHDEKDFYLELMNLYQTTSLT